MGWGHEVADWGKQTCGYSPGRVIFWERDKSHPKVGVILNDDSFHCGCRAVENWLKPVEPVRCWLAHLIRQLPRSMVVKTAGKFGECNMNCSILQYHMNWSYQTSLCPQLFSQIQCHIAFVVSLLIIIPLIILSKSFTSYTLNEFTCATTEFHLTFTVS